ncbi:hypothetical protein E2K99_17025 [Herbaspirillum huttiense]|jgi:hypothetical protein|uniref:hypothetical protein n=1 Tax=Herbaspirillum huttiense TaxID=863372 RepID=UPI0010650041|nr:hypothetical protein [Herbaspirillum huttiense]QBP76598.1 hypothetical protein E2K99_17025 [Herbaspirillum huttiense]
MRRPIGVESGRMTARRLAAGQTTSLAIIAQAGSKIPQKGKAGPKFLLPHGADEEKAGTLRLFLLSGSKKTEI